MTTRVRAKIVGRVQGVGFRPTVYRYATALGLGGFVRNDPQGVTLEVEGDDRSVGEFFDQLAAAPPRQAVIETIETQVLGAQGERQFAVVESAGTGAAAVHISPDLATCPDCLRELNSTTDRRAGYAFINCTNCGPRFTIIRDLPYDRPLTAMAGFTMCPACDAEYHDPTDRRFHAQPAACPRCGPRLRFEEGRGKSEEGNDEGALRCAVEALRAGRIVAIKGLGGYHLACDAFNAAAVARLRARKHRPHKPLAVMFRDMETIRAFCEVSEAEEAELLAVARPIVILQRRSTGVLEWGSDGNDGRKASTPILHHSITPDAGSLGAFLPYTPLHHLLLREFTALVMTSGNLTDEPIISDEEELPLLLGPIADAALTHNRPIVHKCDDSVVRVVNGQRQFVRRARGFAPNSIRLAVAASPHILAVGGELKNTFCLVRDGYAFLSPHIGDLQEYKTGEYFTREIAAWQRLMRVRPTVIAHDLHPDYRSTRWAQERGNGVLEYWSTGTEKTSNTPTLQHSNTPILVPVQHHHAHIASVLGEHGLAGPVIGVALDGTGYGPDGTVWGGEFLVADTAGYERVAHFQTYRLPGGERAIAEPWRMSVSVAAAEGLLEEWTNGRMQGWQDGVGAPLHESRPGPTPGPSQEGNYGAGLPSSGGVGGGSLGSIRDGFVVGSPTLPLFHPSILPLIRSGFNSPWTSSAGRLFDAVAALLGLGDVASYEAQAAIRLEAAADPEVTAGYPFTVATQATPWVLSFGPAIRALLADRRRGVAVATIAARFHNTVAAAIAEVCERLGAARGLSTVALSGGVFQNELLLRRVVAQLQARHLAVYTNSQVPPNDGGLALGQAVVAAARLAPDRSPTKRTPGTASLPTATAGKSLGGTASSRSAEALAPLRNGEGANRRIGETARTVAVGQSPVADHEGSTSVNKSKSQSQSRSGAPCV